MDVAVFRLSKKDKRAGELIRYDLPDGYVEVSAGAHGMASAWDYDIVLMMVSHLTEAMNRYREGKGGKPGECFGCMLATSSDLPDVVTVVVRLREWKPR